MLQRLPNQPSPGPIAKMRDAAGRWLSNAFTRWHTRRARALLEGLSDETLRDIGITRGEVTDVARRVAGSRRQSARGLPDVRLERKECSA